MDKCIGLKVSYRHLVEQIIQNRSMVLKRAKSISKQLVNLWHLARRWQVHVQVPAMLDFRLGVQHFKQAPWMLICFLFFIAKGRNMEQLLHRYIVCIVEMLLACGSLL